MLGPLIGTSVFNWLEKQPMGYKCLNLNDKEQLLMQRSLFSIANVLGLAVGINLISK